MSHAEIEILLEEAGAAIKCAKVKLHENTDTVKFREYVNKGINKLTQLLHTDVDRRGNHNDQYRQDDSRYMGRNNPTDGDYGRRDYPNNPRPEDRKVY